MVEGVAERQSFSKHVQTTHYNWMTFRLYSRQLLNKSIKPNLYSKKIFQLNEYNEID